MSAPAPRIAAALATIGALTFVGIGLAFMIAPRSLAAAVMIDASAAITAAEVRTIYGGLEVGLGLGLLWLCRRGEVRTALTLLALLFAGMVAGRGLSLALDGAPEFPGPLLAALESLGLVGALVGRRLAAAAAPA